MYRNVDRNIPDPLWSLSGHHYGDKVNMHKYCMRFSLTISVVMCRGDDAQGGLTIKKITKVVTTMVTK